MNRRRAVRRLFGALAAAPIAATVRLRGDARKHRVDVGAKPLPAGPKTGRKEPMTVYIKTHFRRLPIA